MIEICLGIPLQSVTLFLPQIIGRLGYSTIKTNLYTVAPNCTGAAMLLILAFASDYTRWRFPFIALGFFFTFCGMVIYSAIDVLHELHVAYFACFMMTWGTSAPSGGSPHGHYPCFPYVTLADIYASASGRVVQQQHCRREPAFVPDKVRFVIDSLGCRG